MPSLFPDLFDFSFLAGALLRFVAAYVFCVLGSRLLATVRSLPHDNMGMRLIGSLLGGAQLAVAALLAVGFLTQGAAIAGILLANTPLFGRMFSAGNADRVVRLLLTAICVAIILIGPGPLAYDIAL